MAERTGRTNKERVLAVYPEAYISKVIWPCDIYWVHASPRHKDSFSVGKPRWQLVRDNNARLYPNGKPAAGTGG